VLGGAEGIGWGFRRATAPCGSTNVGCVRRARAYVLEDARGFVVMARQRTEVGVGELVLEGELRSGRTEWKCGVKLDPRETGLGMSSSFPTYVETKTDGLFLSGSMSGVYHHRKLVILTSVVGSSASQSNSATFGVLHSFESAKSRTPNTHAFAD
jgi:hypothetical protein